MDRTIGTQRLLHWLLFILIASLVLFLRLLPINVTAGRWPGPDVILVLGFAWVLRRPSFIPVGLFAAIMFIFDMVLLRSPGLWAGLSVIGLEFLRSRSRFSRELPFLFEWAMVSAVLSAIATTNRLILGVFVIPQPAFTLDLIFLAGSIATYPLLVIFSANLLGIRKMAPGEVDQLGHRI